MEAVEQMYNGRLLEKIFQLKILDARLPWVPAMMCGLTTILNFLSLASDDFNMPQFKFYEVHCKTKWIAPLMKKVAVNAQDRICAPRDLED